MLLLCLSVGISIFIYAKLREAEVPALVRNIFISFAILVSCFGAIAAFDFGNPYYDIMPGRLAEVLRAIAMTWAIVTILAFIAVILIEAFTLFAAFTRKKLYAAIIITLIGTLYCMSEAYFVRPVHVTISTPKLEAPKLRIVFASDIHIGGLSTIWHLQRIVDIINDAQPDILLLGGDTIDGDMSCRERELALLSQAAKNARYGAYAVNGNHEHYHILDYDVEGIIRDCGFKLLIDERVEAGGIVIVGFDDRHYGWIKPYLQPEDVNRFVLLLKHRPGVPFDSDGRVDLQLSGHTHGGQFWPLGYFKSIAQHITQGLSRKSGGWVYVTNGAGFNGAAMRLFAWPEVVIIDIIRE